MTIERWRPFWSIERWGSISQHFRHPGRGQPTLRQLFWTGVGRRDRLRRRMWHRSWTCTRPRMISFLNFEASWVREKDVSLSITGDLLTVRGGENASTSNPSTVWESRSARAAGGR